MVKVLDIRINARDAATATFNSVSTAVGGLAGRLRNAGLAARNMAAMMLPVTAAMRGAWLMAGRLGITLRRTLTMGIFGLAAAIMIIPRALNAMRGALEKTADAGGGAGAGLADTAAGAAVAADDIDSAAGATLSSAEKAKVAFGAFGDVGAGFIQSQGRITEGAQSNAQDALAAAEDASEALAETESGFGSATTAASRFGSAMDRISAALGGAIQKILAAIGVALTPALEKLADFLESPVFQKFVDLLAKDLATAIGAVATWFIDKAIPALAGFLEKVNAAGGPIEFFKQKWQELKDTVMRVIGIILGKLLEAKNTIDTTAALVKLVLVTAFESVRDKAIVAFQGLMDFVDTGLAAMKKGWETVWGGILTFVEGIIDSIGEIVQVGINAIIVALNGLIKGYNKFGDKFGLPQVGEIPSVSLASGAIVSAPVNAIVGDNPRSPEVVAPLDNLVGIMREALRGNTGGNNLAIYVTVPAGTANPQVFGDLVGVNIAQAMRRRGLQIPSVL